MLLVTILRVTIPLMTVSLMANPSVFLLGDQLTHSLPPSLTPSLPPSLIIYFHTFLPPIPPPSTPSSAHLSPPPPPPHPPVPSPGIFTGHAAIELYAEAFESVNALDKLEPFLSFFGQKFYKIKRNTRRIKLVKESWTVPLEYSFGSSVVRPLRAGETIGWSFKALN